MNMALQTLTSFPELAALVVAVVLVVTFGVDEDLVVALLNVPVTVVPVMVVGFFVVLVVVVVVVVVTCLPVVVTGVTSVSPTA